MSESIPVLVVDDEPEFGDLTAMCLEREREDVAVSTAEGAETALRMLDGDSFDCVVSDYDMPAVDGLEFLRRVRERFPDLPFVLFTGAGSEAVASEAVSAGVSEYVRKGTGTDQFAALADRIVDLVDAEERTVADRLGRLRDAVAEIGAGETDREVYDLTVEAAADVLGADRCSIAVVPDGEFAPGPGDNDGEVAATGEVSPVSDVAVAGDAAPANGGSGSRVAVPIDDRRVLHARTDEPGGFDDDDRVLAALLAAHAAQVLARLHCETRLRDREAELDRETDRVEELASVLSHDLRNPLGVAHGYLRLLAEEVDHDHVDAIDRAHDRMRSITDALLTLSRQGSRVERADTVDLDAVVRDAWAAVGTEDATLEVAAAATIRADRSRLQEILERLLDNAVVHGGLGVTVRVGRLESDAGFFVGDDGPGVPAEERSDVFGAGYSTVEDGIGFGLRIVQSLARAHGWSVRLTDGDLGGARVAVTGVTVVEDDPRSVGNAPNTPSERE